MVLLVVLLLLGACCLLAAAAGAFVYFKKPGLLRLGGVQKARQKAALADLSVIGTALEEYRLKNGTYPPVNRGKETDFGIGDFTELKRHLEPDFLAALPEKDPWGNPYLYGATVDGGSCVLLCMGSDGRQGTEDIPGSPVGTACFQDDIIWRDGALLQSPKGDQKDCQ